MISNFHENKVVQPKFDRTKNKTPSLTVMGIIALASAHLLNVRLCSIFPA